MSKILSTVEMMKETKQTGKVAIIVEVPSQLEPYQKNWLGSGMFFDEKYSRYCVNQWVKNFGYPSLTPDELKEDDIRKDIKWVMDEQAEITKPLKDCSVGYQYYQ